MKNNHQPIAIVGMACRFPGEANNPEKFWDLLINQKDAMVEVPETRWNTKRFCSDNPASKGKMYNRLGAFLSQPITQFDPGLFSIPPREAECLDPQQRLLLEVSWEAMENAGQNVQALAGQNIGVFIGGFTLDHLINQMSSQSRNHIGAHTAVGSTLTVLSNRISHTFDFRGPSISMDTACSSSLVAFHQACLAIKNGDCHMSLVGGVNIMMRPEYPITMCKGGFLAKDSHCKSFDESADGYARGEGAGIVIIKSLEQAIKDKDPILAVVNSSGVNQDGRTNGITVPNPVAQKDLIKRVCKEGEINPANVAYVEAHGTGTPVGDPIEADAIGSIYGAGRSVDNPVVIGSLKSNVGHLEAAAGIAGVIKAVLCLQKNEIPALATLKNPNPNIPFEALGLKLAREKSQLTNTPDDCSIGINSFGYGGTNAHVLISSPKPFVELDDFVDSEINLDVIPFSANDKAALNELLNEYLQLFSHASDAQYPQIIRSLQSRRTPLRERLCIISNNKEKTCNTLQKLIDGITPDNVRQGHNVDEKNKGPVFVYTGMGPQWWGMGQALYQAEPVFKKTVDEIDQLFAEVAGYSILDEMMKDEANSNMASTLISQPANFALQIALTELLKSQGVKPAAVIGHSLGEISSAYVAGAVDLKDAVNIIYYRSMIIKKIAGTGGMLAVAISQDVAESLIEDPSKLSIAAVNSPNMITFAGEDETLKNLETVFTEEGIFCRMLQVEVPFHSPMVEPLKEEVYAALDSIIAHKPHTNIYSTVEGKLANSVDFDVHYWFRNMRQPVLFDGAVKDILDDGYKVFLEVGPHPVLSASLKECFKVYKSNAVTLASLRRGEAECEQSRLCLADINVVSNAIDWQEVNGSVPYITLPNYKWQREEFWSEPEAARLDRAGTITSPYLGFKTPSAKPEWTLEINENYIPYIQDHRIDDLAVLPGAAYLESFSQLYQYVFNAHPNLSHVQFHSPIVFDETDWPNVEISFNAETNSAQIHQINASGSAKLVAQSTFLEPRRFKVDDTSRFDSILRKFDGVDVDSNETFYALTDSIGLGYRNDYRSLDNIKAKEMEVLAQVDIKNIEQAQQHCVYPPALDACFQSLLSALFKANLVSGPVVPVSVGNINITGALNGSVQVYSQLVRHDEQSFVCDLAIFDKAGVLLVEVKELTCEPVNRSSKYLSVDHINKRSSQYVYSAIDPINIELQQYEKFVVLSSDGNVLTLCEGIENSIPMRLPNATDDQTWSNLSSELKHLMANDVNHIFYMTGMSLNDLHPDGLRSEMLHVTGLLRSLPESIITLTLVSLQAHKVKSKDNILPSQTAFMNFFRVVANETEDVRIRSIDLPEFNRESIVLAVKQVQQNSPYDELALREGMFFEPKLIRTQALTQSDNILLHDGDGFELVFQEFLGCKVITKLEALSDSTTVYCEASTVKAIGDLVIGSGVNNSNSQSGIALALGDLTNRIKLNDAQSIWLAHSSILTDEQYTASIYPYALADLILQQMGMPGEDKIIILSSDQIGFSFSQLLKNSGAKIYMVQDPEFSDDKKVLNGIESYLHIDELSSLVLSANLIVGPVQSWLRKAYLGNIFDHSVVVDTSGLFVSESDGAKQGASSTLLARAAQVIKPDSRLLLSTFKGMFTEAVSRSIARLEKGMVEPLSFSQILPVQWQEQKSMDSLVSLKGKNWVAQYQHSVPIDSTKAHIVTGGFGGFGKRVALWLVEQGAKHLVLIGRSGAKTQQDEEFVSLLKEVGVQVIVEKCDVAIESQVNLLISQLIQNGLALGSIFHCAGVLDDKAIIELDSRSINSVLQAKALGAYHLHQATKDQPLDLFVLFSSIASDVGNSMQASYVTANGYLDGLAHARRTAGLPASSINWGAIDDVGMVADDENVRKHFAQMGVYPVPANEAIQVMEESIKRNIERITYADIDWNKWARVEKIAGKSNKFSELVDQQAVNDGNGLVSELLTLSPEDRLEILASLLTEILSVELNTSAEQIERSVPMVELGVDSLLATSLQMSIEDQFSVAVSVIELAGDGTLNNLAEKILSRIEL